MLFILVFSMLTFSSASAIPLGNSKQEINKINWEPCKNNQTFQCGFLLVPIDYSNPKSDYIKLPVSLHKATKKRLGYLFFNFGGPWANNVAVLPSITKARLSKIVIEHFDLITLSPRGVNPNLISCQAKDMNQIHVIEQELKKALLNPSSDQNEKIVYELTYKKQSLCKYSSLYQFASTSNTIKDIDQLRQALQINKLNFYCDSYGSRLGLAYLLQYSDHINMMILDGNLLPDNNFKSFVAMRAKGAVIAYQAFFNYCAKAQNNCPLYHKAPKTMLTANMMEEQVNTLIQKSKINGIPTSIKYNNHVFSSGMLTNLIYTEMDSSTWSQLANGLNQAILNDNADQLMTLYITLTNYDPKSDTYKTDTNSATLPAVICKDYYVSSELMNEDTWLQFVNTIKSNYSSIGSTASAWISPLCINWPANSDPLLPQNPKQIQSFSPKVLLIGNAQDPMMPFTNDEALEIYLKNLKINISLLKWNAFGHTALLIDSPLSSCVFKNVDQFLLTGKLPKQRICNDWNNPFNKIVN